MAVSLILVLLCCGLIAYQDIKSRMVYWFLFPVLAISLAMLHLSHNTLEVFLYHSSINSILVTCILLILYIATRFIFKRRFLNSSIGLGDLLFFYAFAMGFPTVTFLWLFTGALVFSAMLHFLFKAIRGAETVPLAGFMGIFLIASLLYQLFPNTPSLYLF